MTPVRAASALTKLRTLRPLRVAALALALAGVVHLGGCDGGTSTEAGNPSFTLQIRGTDGDAPFHGFVQFFAQGSNPAFFTAPPDDGLSSEGTAGGDLVSTIVLTGGNSVTISRDLLSHLVNPQPMQPLFKASGSQAAQAREIAKFPEFNIVLSGIGAGFDSTCGWLSGIRSDTVTGRFRFADGTGGDTLIIDVGHGKSYAGAVDTAGMASRPLGLFVPGTPYYASIVGDSFRFRDIPAGKLPLRLLSTNGWIYDMEDSLGSSWTHPLKTRRRTDSVAMPQPNPSLTPPTAMPPGQFAFTDSVSVGLTSEEGAQIYYTLDGSTPDIGSKHYSGPISLRASATLKAVAFLKGHNRSPIAVNNYVLVPASPTASPTSQVFKDSLAVSLSAPVSSASIFYSLDGSVPNEKSLKYAGPIILKATTSLKAVTIQAGLGSSRMIEEKYVLAPDSTTAKLDSLPAPPIPHPGG